MKKIDYVVWYLSIIAGMVVILSGLVNLIFGNYLLGAVFILLGLANIVLAQHYGIGNML